LRVTLYKQEIGIFHAGIAQLFLLLVSSIALFLSKGWQRLSEFRGRVNLPELFRPLALAATLLILIQLALGATMRHQHAGLAVPDFPLAYGKGWPPTDAAFLEEINSKRLDVRDYSPITASQIHLHMAHRMTAVVILLAVAACAWGAFTSAAPTNLKGFAAAWLALILIQAGLGAWTVWSNKAADVATAHVLFGAIGLVWGGLLYISSLVVSAPSASAKGRGAEVALPEGSRALA
jgi:cytochrome c oxidase assembly protein subunit 15